LKELNIEDKPMTQEQLKDEKKLDIEGLNKKK